MKSIIKKITNLLALSTLSLLLMSCSVSPKEWHYSAAKVGAKSIYIKKDGTKSISERVGNKFVIKYFDANGKEIKSLEEAVKLERDPYKNPNSLKNQVFISDQRM